MKRIHVSLVLCTCLFFAVSCGSDSGKKNTPLDVVDAVADLTDSTSTPDVPTTSDWIVPDLHDVADILAPDSVDVVPTDTLADLAGDVSDPDITDTTDTADVTTTTVAWGTCPDYISQSLPKARCALVPMPLDHNVEGGPTIDIFVYRVPSMVQNGKRQIWFLQGGPGGSGADFASIFASYAKAHPNWELYSLDHRGVGNSARLTCPQEDYQYSFDYAGCVQSLQQQWGDGLMKFTTTQASYDLGKLVEMMKQPDVPVFVYGASYGTYWALRYLRLYPNQANGTILDSICAPGACHLDEYDQNFNENGHLLMDACGADATCGAKMASIDADPWTAVGKVFQKVDDGTLCDGEFNYLDRPTLRAILGMGEADRTLRQLIPALLYRLYRCDQKDKDVINYFFAALQGMVGGASLTQVLDNYQDLEASATLGTHIINSELSGDSTLEEVQAIVDAAFFSTDAAPGMLEISESGVWPIYPDDGHMNRFGDTTQPILMLNGTLDPQTTMAMAKPAGDYYKGANQTFVEVPEAPHGTLFTSFTPTTLYEYFSGSQDYFTTTCGYQMFEGFVFDPTQPIDKTCLGNLAPLDFTSTSDMNRAISSYLMGTEDMYEGEASPMSLLQAPIRPANPLMPPLRTRNR